jgi:hypothetical protein
LLSRYLHYFYKTINVMRLGNEEAHFERDGFDTIHSDRTNIINFLTNYFIKYK